ncbi:hypothetical protein ACQJBY_000823 [Aegilops geniculata]
MSAASVVRLSRSATRFVAKAASGFHLLCIDGYSQTKTILPGQKISSMAFAVGGHSWRMDYYPNGRDTSAKSNAVSVYLQRIDRGQVDPLQAQYKFSLVDHAGNAAYELPAQTGTFISVPEVNVYHHHAATGTFGSPAEGEPGPGCGLEEFIVKEELEKREHLIRNDCLMVRCDVGVTEVGTSWLAMDEITNDDEEEDSDDDGYGAGTPRRRRRDDGEYVKWCLAQRPR